MRSTCPNPLRHRGRSTSSTCPDPLPVPGSMPTATARSTSSTCPDPLPVPGSMPTATARSTGHPSTNQIRECRPGRPLPPANPCLQSCCRCSPPMLGMPAPQNLHRPAVGRASLPDRYPCATAAKMPKRFVPSINIFLRKSLSHPHL
jgi:hypothetical protein